MSGWEDTVMGQWTRYGKHFLEGKHAYLEAREPKYNKHIEEAAVDAGCKAVALAQAETTWPIAKQEGRREVVEWIQAREKMETNPAWTEDWQAFLKERGL